MDDASPQGASRLAIAVGIIGAGSAISLGTFFAFGGPFGTLNDIGNGALGLLSAALAWRLRDGAREVKRDLATWTAVAGGAITVVGSYLVISGTTGYFQAGLVSTAGFAGIGAWVLSHSRDHITASSRGLRGLGLAAGALMALGALAVPGIVLQLDAMANAPGWIWLAETAWLGTYVVYPAWTIWLGTAAMRSRRVAPTSASHGPDEREGHPSWTGG